MEPDRRVRRRAESRGVIARLSVLARVRLFPSRPERPLERSAEASPVRRLSVCPVCGADFVVPVDWVEYDDEHWAMVLGCGACATRRSTIASDTEVEALCQELDRGLARLAAGAAHLRHERMTAEIDRFAAALELDLISADDFAR